MSHALRVTTNVDAPVCENQIGQTSGDRGPILLQDLQLLDKLAANRTFRLTSSLSLRWQ